MKIKMKITFYHFFLTNILSKSITKTTSFTLDSLFLIVDSNFINHFNLIKMYKTYNFQPNFLSQPKKNYLNSLAEKLVPFLIIAATFVWLWK